MMQETLPALTADEYKRAHTLLASRVAHMMGRKLEEDDWTGVYCAAKGIPAQGWSNLNIDVIHLGLGVEHKMLCKPSDKSILSWCGTTQMHPALTRSIRIESTDEKPDVVMRSVFSQYAELVEGRKQKVRESARVTTVDVRIGWLLWQESLSEFLYFEYAMVAPNPDDYWAEWRETKASSRKASKNLWIYHKGTGQKRYSVTTQAGIKIQPYFDIPPPNDPNLYYFVTQGETLEGNLVRIWITLSTARELKSLLGDLETQRISSIILKASSEVQLAEDLAVPADNEARELLITREAYVALQEAFEGVSDEHRMQLLLTYLREHSR
jgi:hypothetical protein